MSTEAISATTFIREYTRELRGKNAAIFAGAGMSMASGYVDWKGLLSEIIQDLGLDPNREPDLVSMAQYHCNQAGGNKNGLTQTIFSHFSATRSPTPNHKILASLPILTYWTTNYDKLIEKSLEEAKKVPDVKYTLSQLSVTRPDRDVVVYKMHGDIDNPSEAVITKDDYESYPVKMAAFGSALRGDLVEKTFLFLGFSFTDPNIDFILSRVRVQYEKHQRHHYCIQRKVVKHPSESDTDFSYRQLKQEYFIRDLKRFSIYTVLVDNYEEVTELLATVAARYRRTSVFISGAAEEFGSWTRSDGLGFVHRLSQEIAKRNNRLITGFGINVGGAVINGALAHFSEVGKTISDDALVMRPFPQVETGVTPFHKQWTSYRRAMIDHAGIAVFVFGNKRSDSNIVLSSGMKEEFDLCVEAGVCIIPVGSTGFMAAQLWSTVNEDIRLYYPAAEDRLQDAFRQLNNPKLSVEELVSVVIGMIDQIQRM